MNLYKKFFGQLSLFYDSMSLYNNSTWLIISLVIIYVLVVFISAWLSDDAYVTFRSIDNFINGYGLTWNISERVQTYTHPLWMFIISAFYFFTREIYFTSLFISIIISCAAVYLLLSKFSGSLLNLFIIWLIIIFSKSFIDYSTSGLENPLSHLLIVLFFFIYFKQGERNKKLLILSIISSLAVLNRMDIILIFLPALVTAYLKADRKKGLLIIAAGFLPFILWEMFSLFYYGFPFPNTAYAKLNTGIDQTEFIMQGLNYLLNSLFLDPLTFAVIISGLFIFKVKKYKSLFPISIGIVLYLIYILKIGGDFMSGRFLSVPLLCTLIIISKIEIKFNKAVFIFPVLLLLMLFTPNPNFLNNYYYGLGPVTVSSFIIGPKISLNNNNGIVDERYNYFLTTGLIRNINERNLYNHPWIINGIDNKRNRIKFLLTGTIGFVGFYSGSSVHILDKFALSDPLLSKLPSTEYWIIGQKPPEGQKSWKIGHFTRKFPDGYIETLKTGRNKIEDENLRKYYDKLSFVIKGDLFDINRISEIWNLNTGKYDHLIEAYSKTLK